MKSPVPLSPVVRYQTVTDPALVAEVLEILADHDPIGLIAQGAPRDEYLPEARTIAYRITGKLTRADLLTIIHDEFAYWFGDQAGFTARYRSITAAVWQRLAGR
jgi:hypothetical protein